MPEPEGFEDWMSQIKIGPVPDPYDSPAVTWVDFELDMDHMGRN